MPSARLIFVYNADDGFFNALMDSAHKVFSPSTYECSLCRFTYGLTSMVLPWKKFIESLGRPMTFLHRREFRQAYPELAIDLPVILIESSGQPEVLLSATDIKAAASLDGLIVAVRRRLAEVDAAGRG